MCRRIVTRAPYHKNVRNSKAVTCDSHGFVEVIQTTMRSHA
jgi:hypothetical protein